MNTSAAVYPVLFTLSEVVSGNGFLAGVAVEGRGSMVQEEDGWWLYGVQPGTLAEDGDNPQEAHLKFVVDFKNVLFDIAGEAPTFERFKEEVERVLSQINEPEAARWADALEAISAGRVPLKDPYLAALPKRTATPFRIVVQRLDKSATLPTPKLNKPSVLALPEAA